MSSPIKNVTAFERGTRCASWLHAGRSINAPWLCQTFGVSKATAKRDLIELERALPVKRDNGTLVLMGRPA